MKKIVHIITGLNMGGAERMLYNVVTTSNNSKYEHTVISMMDMGYYGHQLKERNIQVFCLNMTRGVPRYSSIFEARRICKDADIIQTWMYHADLFGTLVKILLPGKKLIWGIRLSDVDPNRDTKSTIRAAAINSRLSWIPQAIVCNSISGIENHVRLGYKRDRIKYVPNGIDTDIYYKRENKASEKPLVLCTVGRWNIQKGYAYLIAALGKVKSKRNDFKLLMCGNQLSEDNEALVKLINDAGIFENVRLLGPCSEVYNILSKADIFVLPSLGEGFSNALGEAMACELPCIVTDVGDSAEVLGDSGWVVPPRDSDALAAIIINSLEADIELLREMGVAARKRIVEQFSIIRSVGIFETLYEEVTNKLINGDL